MPEQKLLARERQYIRILVFLIFASLGLISYILSLYKSLPPNSEFGLQDIVQIFAAGWLMCLVHNWAYIFSMTKDQMKYEMFNASDKVLLVILVSFVVLQNYLKPGIDLLRSFTEAIEVFVWFGVAILLCRIIPEILHYKELIDEQGV